MVSAEITSTEFLMRVWREQCQPGEFVCLSAKGSSWKDYSFPFETRERVSTALTEYMKKRRRWITQTGYQGNPSFITKAMVETQ